MFVMVRPRGESRSATAQKIANDEDGQTRQLALKKSMMGRKVEHTEIHTQKVATLADM
jgi:hypothetical protein